MSGVVFTISYNYPHVYIQKQYTWIDCNDITYILRTLQLNCDLVLISLVATLNAPTVLRTVIINKHKNILCKLYLNNLTTAVQPIETGQQMYGYTQ